MKKLGVYLLGGISALSSFNISAQSLEETALLFSRTTNGGSARIMGMGGTQVSLGGDFSSASSNPAGLGMFNRSEVSISPGFFLQNNISKYFGDSLNTTSSKLAIPSFGAVFHYKTNDESPFRSSLAITLTRLNNFNAAKEYQGYNPNNSITDYFATNSYGRVPNDLPDLNYMAYSTYLIDSLYLPNDNLPSYTSPVGININDITDLPDVLQHETITTSGAQNQWSLAYGANINDKFFLGGGLHVRTINYKSKKVYTESDYYFPKAPSWNPLNSLVLEEDLSLTGTGLSATLGAIFRPADFIQIGASYNTPTSYYMKDVYSASLTANWNNFDYGKWVNSNNPSYVIDDYQSLSTNDLYNGPVINKYKLKTPGKISGGATVFFGKLGLASLEVESINYGNALYRPRITGDNYNNENSNINSMYKNNLNYRLGAEFRLKMFRFRVGAGHLSNPNRSSQNNIYRAVTNGSLGVGIRQQKFYVDAALTFTNGRNSYHPYTLPSDYSSTPTVKQINTTVGLMFTVGYNF